MALVQHGLKWGFITSTVLSLGLELSLTLGGLFYEFEFFIKLFLTGLVLIVAPAILVGTLTGAALAKWVLRLYRRWPYAEAAKFRERMALLPGVLLFVFTCFASSPAGGWLRLFSSILTIYSLTTIGFGKYIYWCYTASLAQAGDQE